MLVYYSENCTISRET